MPTDSMSTIGSGSVQWRYSPFNKGSASSSPGFASPVTMPKNSIITSPPGTATPPAHHRNQSFSPQSGPSIAPLQLAMRRSNSARTTHQSTSTFAPKFIKTEESQRPNDKVGGIEGENDFSGKRYVWLRDSDSAFVRGWIVEELHEGRLLVQCDDESV